MSNPGDTFAASILGYQMGKRISSAERAARRERETADALRRDLENTKEALRQKHRKLIDTVKEANEGFIEKNDTIKALKRELEQLRKEKEQAVIDTRTEMERVQLLMFWRLYQAQGSVVGNKKMREGAYRLIREELGLDQEEIERRVTEIVDNSQWTEEIHQIGEDFRWQMRKNDREFGDYEVSYENIDRLLAKHRDWVESVLKKKPNPRP